MEDSINSTTLPRLRRFERTFLVFEGRIGRLRYLVHAILLPIAALIVLGVFILALASLPEGGPIGKGFNIILSLIQTTLWITFVVLGIWISLSAGVRRLHDMGYSGWFMLLNLVPFVGLVFGLVLLVWPGQEGENKYDPQPEHTGVG